jgi:hypothetical protein
MAGIQPRFDQRTLRLGMGQDKNGMDHGKAFCSV